MANSYTQLYAHIIFAVRFRAAVIHSSWEDSLYKYITTTIQNDGHKMMIINGVADHVHLLVGFNPDVALSNLVLDIKRASGNFIRDNRFCNGKFNWQNGYSAFSVSKSIVPRVAAYIANQKQHHRKESLQVEIRDLLTAAEIEFDDRYIFSEPV